MALFSVIETINDPGDPKKTGDDRYGFDEAVGSAWVLDGATDVTELRPFPQMESGAAWIAETLSDLLMSAPWPEDEASDYWRRVMRQARIRADKESKLPLEGLPPEAWPIAAGVWMRLLEPTEAEFAWLGDCICLLKTSSGVETIGSPDKADSETADAKRLLALAPEARRHAMANERRDAATSGYSAFGLRPDAADHLMRAVRTVTKGAEAILMTDGLYRLISPYKKFNAKSLFELISKKGLAAAIDALRKYEAADKDAAKTRLKPRDDAAAVWLRFGG